MLMKTKILLRAWLAAAALPALAGPGQFEARQTHSLALEPAGNRLLALNSPAGSLVVYELTASSPHPVCVAEIPVGKEPVSVRWRNADEAWVVCELADVVQVVSLSRRAVVDSLPCPDEPADVCFAAGKAFVSSARSNGLTVFDAQTRASLGTITLQGLVPRALAANATGTRLYVSFFHSGNRTTILPANRAPAPPAPTNPALPAAPQVGKIVPREDPLIRYQVLDNDVVELDTASLGVLRYFTGVGTNLHDLTVSPDGSKLYVAATEALNLTRFEPALKGHFVDHRISTIEVATGVVTVLNLHNGMDYAAMDAQLALAQPTGLAVSGDGKSLWLAAFGSDRLAKVNLPTQTVAQRVDVRPPTATTMRGPRALAWREEWHRLYVLNKISDTLSVVDTATGVVHAEVPLGSVDLLSAPLRQGRSLLHDARLSGNGVSSCALCHPDADRDGMAWDLGDPGGELVTVMGRNSAGGHSETLVPRVMHPMKGPMVTQTLRGLEGGQPFHWRGDRPTLQSFGVTFRDLLAGSIPSEAALNALASYLQTLRHHPNPHRLLDRGYKSLVGTGSPTVGKNLFNSPVNHCGICHGTALGTNGDIDSPAEVGSPMPMKNASIRTTYQRLFLNTRSGQTSLSGFGMGHDGAFANLPTAHPYVLDDLGAINTSDFAHVAAFVQSFDTGTAPAVGFTRVITAGNKSDATLQANLKTVEQQAELAVDPVDVVLHAAIAGVRRHYRYVPGTGYVPNDDSPVASRADLEAALAATDTLHFQGLQSGEGQRVGSDRDADGLLDHAEPQPSLSVGITSTGPGPGPAPALSLTWPATALDWYLEQAMSPAGPWTPVFQPRMTTQAAGATVSIPLEAPTSKAFFRLRRVW